MKKSFVVLIISLGMFTFLVSPTLGVGVAEESQEEMVTLTVSVVNQNGSPVGGAEITASWSNGSNTATTASNGKAFVDVPKGSNVELDVSHESYTRNFPKEVTNAQETEVTIRVDRKGSARIKIVDSNGPVTDVRITVLEDLDEFETGKTDSNGFFTIDDIEWGEYTVRVYKSGYFSKEASMEVNGSVEKEIPIETGSVSMNFKVIDPHFDPPKAIKGARINVEDIGSVNTLDNGEASLSVPVNSRFEVTVNKKGYVNGTKRINVRENDPSVNFSISRVPEVKIEAVNKKVVVGETVRIEVRNEYGEPFEGAGVLVDNNRVGETDSQGVLDVRIESEGNHTLRAVKGDLRSVEINVEGIEPGGEEPETNDGENEDNTSDENESSGEEADLPGFTPLAAVVALILSVYLFSRSKA